MNKLPGYLDGESFQEFCTRTAKRWFPDLPEHMIKENLCVLNAQGQADSLCVSCRDGSTCKTGGHQPFLKIDSKGGYMIPCVDTETCYKYRK